MWLGGTIPFGSRDTISQDSPTVPGGGEDGDRFGSSIAVGDINGDHKADVLVGGPGESIGSALETGSIWIIYGGLTTLGSSHDQMFTQSTAGEARAARNHPRRRRVCMIPVDIGDRIRNHGVKIYLNGG